MLRGLGQWRTETRRPGRGRHKKRCMLPCLGEQMGRRWKVALLVPHHVLMQHWICSKVLVMVVEVVLLVVLVQVLVMQAVLLHRLSVLLMLVLLVLVVVVVLMITLLMCGIVTVVMRERCGGLWCVESWTRNRCSLLRRRHSGRGRHNWHSLRNTVLGVDGRWSPREVLLDSLHQRRLRCVNLQVGPVPNRRSAGSALVCLFRIWFD